MVSVIASTVGPFEGALTVADWSASIRRRSRGGISPTTLVSACSEDSAPSTALAAAVRSPTAIATASSSSSSSGGSDAPARSW